LKSAIKKLKKLWNDVTVCDVGIMSLFSTEIKHRSTSKALSYILYYYAYEKVNKMMRVLTFVVSLLPVSWN